MLFGSRHARIGPRSRTWAPLARRRRQVVGRRQGRLFDGRGKPDFTVFPILFLYRPALELALKGIIAEHGFRVGLDVGAEFKKWGHKLAAIPLPRRRYCRSGGSLRNTD